MDESWTLHLHLFIKQQVRYTRGNMRGASGTEEELVLVKERLSIGQCAGDLVPLSLLREDVGEHFNHAGNKRWRKKDTSHHGKKCIGRALQIDIVGTLVDAN